jgi:hypothetical protein
MTELKIKDVPTLIPGFSKFNQSFRNEVAYRKLDPEYARKVDEIRSEASKKEAPLHEERTQIENELAKRIKERHLCLMELLWQIHHGGYLDRIKARASARLATIETKQAKEYQELFPPTCPKTDPGQFHDSRSSPFRPRPAATHCL